MTARDPNIEQDVRAIVRNIVDGLWGDDDVAQDTTVQNPDAITAEEVKKYAYGYNEDLPLFLQVAFQSRDSL